MSGATAGVIAVEGLRWYLGPNHPSIGQPDVQPETVIIAGLVVVVSGCVAGLLPAYRAASIQPVAALRSE
jgi:ABC-type antimicrobial peptide transport system permease subunit